METESNVLIPDVCSEEQVGSLADCNVLLTLCHSALHVEIYFFKEVYLWYSVSIALSI
jgi:hypothetical protein